ncbi:4'-phosphopantetheinyl transferase family protein [Haloglycomyces albus]|uniref:4'-phosphopantetheinyl transferase family protein n=1 Tax=Haloglycomyces albus TaxID=526067 RepID=UPI00046D16D3|nr:4'-phosphopantetheinyl transferase superfamily protein [Haloglycomyces albus]
MIALAVARTDGLDESTYERLRASVPAYRQRKADRHYRRLDRFASVVSFSLLQGLWAEYGEGPLPPIVRDRLGKPRFAESGWHFNLSHDSWICVCALASVSVGVDVQSRVPFDADLFKSMVASSEWGLRDRLVTADDLSALWTRKEAIVKRSGRGLSTPPHEVDTLAARDVLTYSADAEDFRLSLCATGSDVDELASQLRIRRVRPETDAWSSVTCRDLRRVPRHLD